VKIGISALTESAMKGKAIPDLSWISRLILSGNKISPREIILIPERSSQSLEKPQAELAGFFY
jgi:hypothetical protein